MKIILLLSLQTMVNLNQGNQQLWNCGIWVIEYVAGYFIIHFISILQIKRMLSAKFMAPTHRGNGID